MNASSEVVRDDHQEPDRERLESRGQFAAYDIDTIIAAASERARRADWDKVIENAGHFTFEIER